MPSLITNQHQFGPVSVVDLRGGLGLGEGSLTLRRTIRDLVESGRIKIIPNFREVDSIDSAGSWRTCRRSYAREVYWR
jgi:anti-sigma B factor antagonist